VPRVTFEIRHFGLLILLISLIPDAKGADGFLTPHVPYPEIVLSWKWVLFLAFVFSGCFYLTFYHDHFVSGPNQLNRRSRLRENEVAQLKFDLTTLMEEKRPFLNPNLTLKDLADMIETSDKNLSSLLNHHFELTFYEYLNEYRIQLVMHKMMEGAVENYSISGIAFDCGFKSKSSFYRAFKNQVGTSPKEYLRRLMIAR